MVFGGQRPSLLRIPGVGRDQENGRCEIAETYLPARDRTWSALAGACCPEYDTETETISQRLAGIWSIWSVWFISSVWFFRFIWFDERARPHRPGNKNGIDYFSGVFRGRPHGLTVDTISETDAIGACHSGEPTAHEERHARAIVHSLTTNPYGS